MMQKTLIFLSLVLFSFPLLAGRDVSAVRYAPSDLPEQPPSIASNENHFLTLWPVSYLHLYGSLSSTAANSDSPAFPVAPFANTSGAAVIGTGTGYVAIWNERDNVPIFGRLSSSGALERRVPLARNRFFGAALAFNGSRIAIVDSAGFLASTIDISIYDLDGNLLRRLPVTAYNGERWAVTSAGGDFAVMTAGGATGINEWRVTSDGAVLPPIRIQAPPDPSKTWYYAISAGAKNGRIVTSWLESLTGSLAGTIAFATIEPDGAVKRTSLPAGSVPLTREPAVLPVDRGYVIAWNVTPLAPAKPQMFAVRLDDAGTLIDDHPLFLGDGQFTGAASAGDTIKLAVNTSSESPLPVFTSTATVTATGITPYVATAVLSPVRQFAPAIAGNGAGFTAAWLEQAAGERRVVAGRINPAGEPLDGTGITLDSHASAVPPVIAHAPSGELIVWIANGRLLAKRLSPFGGVLDAAPIDIAPLSFGYLDVVWDGSRFFIVWTDGDKFFGAFVGPDGVATSSKDLGVRISTSESSIAFALDAVWDGRQFIVVYAEASPVFCTCFPSSDRVRVFRISASGAAIDIAPVRIPGQHVAAHVASSGSESLIVLDQARGASSVVVRDEGGTLHLDPEVPLFSWLVGASGVTWDGSSYVVAAQFALSPHFQTEPEWLASISVNQSGIPLRTSTTAAAGPPEFTFATPPSIATDVAAGTAVVISEVEPQTSVARARLYLLSEFSTTSMPPPPPAPRNAVSYFGGTTARIDWQSDGGASGFQIEQSIDFGRTWFPVAIAPAGARTITVNAKVGDQFRVRAFGPGGLSDGPITSIGSGPRRRAAGH